MSAKRILSLSIVFALALVVSLGAAGCGAFKANVTVQLVNATNGDPYAVDQMTVYLELKGGSTVSGVTGSTGAVTFAVTKAGTYRVVRVQGEDVSGGQIGEEGREFVKASPLTTAGPEWKYAYSGTFPEVAVEEANQNYSIDAAVPSIQKVTIIESRSIDVSETQQTDVSCTDSFAGRVILRGIDCGRQALIVLRASNTTNYFILYASPSYLSGSFFCDSGAAYYPVPGKTVTAPYGAVFEASGNGDWVLSSAGVSSGREALGGANPSRNFDGFKSGVYLNINNGSMSPTDPPSRFKMSIETQKFTIQP